MIKKIQLSFLIISIALLSGLSGITFISEASESSVEVVSELSLLDQIVTQAKKIITVSSEKTRRAAQRQLLLLMQKKINVETSKKIGNAVAIILKTTKKSLRESQEAYRFLVDFVAAIRAQDNLTKVAIQAKEEVENAPAGQSASVVDSALKQIEKAAKAASDAMYRVRIYLENMVKSSEATVDQKISQLQQIGELAKNVVIAPEDKDRLRAKEKLTSFMQDLNLDQDIKDGIAADIAIIQQTTNGTIEISQKAYDRLVNIIELTSQRVKETVATIEQGKDSIENAPMGSFQKISRSVKNRLENIGNQFMGLMYSGATMLPLSYITRQDMLKSRIEALLRIIAFSKNQELRMNAQQEFNTLVQGEELDKAIQRSLVPLLEKIKNASVITEDDILYIKHICERRTQLRILQKIKHYAYSIAFYLTNQKFDQENKDVQEVILWMNDSELYQKIKDEINPDIQIILESSDKASQKSKQEAFERLKNTIDYDQSILGRTKKTVMSGRSKILNLMPEAVREFIIAYPLIETVSLSLLAGCAIGKFIAQPLVLKYRMWEANYAHLQTSENAYRAIVNSVVRAHKSGEIDKYHTLMGVLEEVGIEIDEIFNDRGELKGIYHGPLRNLWSEKAKQLYPE